VTASTFLLRGGHVLSLDPGVGDVAAGDVLVRDGVIVEIGKALEVPGDVPDVPVIDAAGTVVMPGMIDTHVHLWQTAIAGAAADIWGNEYRDRVLPMRGRYTPEDVYAATYAGALAELASGVTTVLDFAHCLAGDEHVAASIQAVRDAAVGAFHGHSLADVGGGDHPTRLRRAERTSELIRSTAELDGMVLGLSDFHPDAADRPAVEIDLARSLGVPMTFHSDAAGDVEGLAARGLLGADQLVVHGNLLTAEEIALLADAGAALVVTPEVEIALGKPMFTVGDATRVGCTMTLGLCMPSLAGYGLIPQARLVLQFQRWLDGYAERQAGRLPLRRRDRIPVLSPRAAVEAVTSNAARALGMEATIGTLAPGKRADIVVIDTPWLLEDGEDLVSPVLQAGTGSIRTVFVKGTPRFHRGEHVGVDMDLVAGRLRRARRAVYRV
jgi:cytosine/adenosine deaminase-related metal-dependent hydrolase